MTTIQPKDSVSFSELVNEAKTASVMLMRGALDLMPADLQHKLAAAQGAGNRIALETSLTQEAEWSLCVTLVTPAGYRELIATIATQAKH